MKTPSWEVGAMELLVSQDTATGAAVVVLSGQLDVQTCLVLESALDRLREAALTRVVVDLSEVTFCDSVGLSAFVVGHKYCTAAGGYLRLAAPTPFMIRLLQVVGIAGPLPIYRTVQAACAGDPVGLVAPAHVQPEKGH